MKFKHLSKVLQPGRATRYTPGFQWLSLLVVISMLMSLLPAFPVSADSSSSKLKHQDTRALSFGVLTHSFASLFPPALAYGPISSDPYTFTDARGAYRFTGLDKGSHRMTLDLTSLPASLRSISTEVAPVVWVAPGISVVSEITARGVRFTVTYDRESGDLSGVVYVDKDGDGQQDGDEPGLPNVRVIDPTAHQYFVPFDDNDLWDMFDEKLLCHGSGHIGAVLNSSIFLVSSYDGTVYYYDHWEDGYDADPLVPSASTEVGVLDAGAVQLFQSNITKAALGTFPYLYDGRDRVTVFGERATFVRMVYPESPGTVLASAWEISEVADWGVSFVTVLGEDLDFNGEIADDSDFSGISVMAVLPNTQVYYKGSLAATLATGGSYFINGADDGAGGGGVDSTDSITATAPVQVQMLVGGCGNANSGNGHSLDPIERWGDAYWSPVPGFSCVGYDSDLYVHNPGNAGIVVTATSNLGTVAMPVPAHTTRSLLDYARSAAGWEDISNGSSGVHLYSADKFWGVGVVDSATDGTGDSHTYDWSFSLVPEYDLSSQVVVGYAPGTGAASPANNGNSAFVTAITNTVIYVDLNQDGLADPFDMNGDGDAADNNAFAVAAWDEPLSALGIPLSPGQTVRVGDPRDRNLQGALIYTLDYQHKIAAAWGQDLCIAGTGAPYLDLGYTIYPLPVPTLSKRDDLAVDADFTGDVSPGDTITYTLSLNNNGLGSMNDVILTDTLPFTYTDFAVGSLIITTPPPIGTIEYYNGATWGTTSIFNAQAFRVTWPTIGPQQEVTLTFRVQLHTNIPLTVTEITNVAVVDSPKTDPKWSEDPDDPLDPDTDTPIGRPQLKLEKSASPSVVLPGDLVTYTVVLTNTGTGISIDTVISDILPAGLTYVPNTLSMTWPLLELQVTTRTVTRTSLFDGYFADDFDLNPTQNSGYTGDDGSLSWSNNWAETNDDANPASGELLVGSTAVNALTAPGYLEIIDNDEDLASLQRGLDLTPFRQPLLRFYIQGNGASGDNYRVLLNGSSVRSVNYNGSYTLVEQSLTAGTGAPATVGFGAEAGMDAGDIYRIDHVAVYEGDPVRTDTVVLSWERVVYSTTVAADPVSYNPLTGLLVITDGMRLPAHGVVLATFQAQVGNPGYHTFLTNTVYVSATNWLDVTESPTATATIEVLVPSLTVDKSSSGGGTFSAGDVMTYTIVVANTGSVLASDVTIYDAVPAHTTYVAGSSRVRIGALPPVAAGVPPNLVTPANGYDLNPGERMTVTFRVTVEDPLTSGVVTIANSAMVTSTGIITPVRDTITDTLLTGIVTGVVYRDNDGNGVYNPGVDTPLGGIDVVITDAAGVAHTVTTGANGVYSATVPAGSAVVDVDNTDLPPNMILTQGSSDPTTVNVPGGGSATDNTGYVPGGTVTGVVYQDNNADGVFTPGVDTPLSGIDVVITDTFGIPHTVTTNASGAYTATIPAGGAVVDVNDSDLPAGLVLTLGSSDPTSITVPVGGIASDNTGYVRTGQVTGVVYLDVNGDGVYTAGTDTPLSGVEVVVTDTFGIPYTVTTNAAGVYVATVPAGSAMVDVNNADLPANAALTTGSTDPTTVTVPVGGSVRDDTGYVLSGVVTGVVYVDMNDDGIYTAGVDMPLSGVTVVVTDTFGTPHTVTTGLNGIYTATVPAGGAVVDVDDNDLPSGAVLATGSTDPTSVTVTVGGVTYDNTGYVVTDHDGDGVPDTLDLDDDDDGIPDTVEGNGDSDGDGVPDYFDLDSDNDGIPDVIEAGGTDANGDGVIDDYSDADGDGLSDNVDPTQGGTPLPVPDTDGDGVPDYTDLDSDNDGIPDVIEAGGADADGDGVIDDYSDDDHDGLSDNVDPTQGGTPLPVPDTDGDGNADYTDLDSDNDGIPDVIEAGGTDANGDGVIDDYSDADGDGLSDNVDPTQGGTPLPVPDTDGDGNADYTDLDSDNDGIPDVTEAGGTDANGDGVIDDYSDADGDGLSDNVDPTQGGTPLPVPDTDGDGNPDYTDLDSDNDGIPDVTEAGGTDANGDGVIDDYSDADGDGLSDNVDPTQSGTPLPVPDTDGDGNPDYTDLDSDNDGIPDVTEAGGTDANGDGVIDDYSDADGDGLSDNVDPTQGGTPLPVPDTDGDGNADYTDLDSDNDGIPDVTEAGGTDANGDGVIDDYSDADGDGLSDNVDPTQGGTPLPVPDTDGDGNADYTDLDSDNDGIPDVTEAGGTDANGDGVIDDYSDADGDGLSDNVDPTQGGTPLPVPDTDGDGNPNYLDIDADDDGIPDNIESQPTVGYIPPSGLDSDGDGLDDAYDPSNGGTPAPITNTDGEDQPDYLDLDSDNDGDSDQDESDRGDPTGVDSDGDGLDDGFDDNIGGWVPNDGITDPSDSLELPDGDGDVNIGGDVDYRDANMCATPLDDYEPDSYFTEATPIPTNGAVLTRTFHIVADKDWVTFYASAGRTYTVTTLNLSADMDTVLQLYAPDGKTLYLENDDYELLSEASRIIWVAPQDGWYYARVTHFDPTYNPRDSEVCGNGYQIRVIESPCNIQTDFYEPDDLYPEAVWAPSDGTLLERTFELVADKDWIKFDAVKGLVYTITTSRLGAAIDTVLQVYDQDGKTLLDENDDYQSDSEASRIIWIAPQNGVYFARVTHFDHAFDPETAPVCGNGYLISVETQLCALPDPYEPDDHYTTAVTVMPSDVFTRSFNTIGDKDWFAFQTLANEVYTLTTFNLSDDTDTIIQVYDTDGKTVLAENDDYLPGSKASLLGWAAPKSGLYYARVTHFDHTYDPRYSLICGSRYSFKIIQDALGVHKFVPNDVGAFKPGEVIDYTIVVWNKLNMIQTNVMITDYIPAHTTFVPGSIHTTQGVAHDPDPLVVNVGNLEVGGRMTVTFQVKIDAGAQGAIANRAVVSSDQQEARVYTPSVIAKLYTYLYLPFIGKHHGE